MSFESELKIKNEYGLTALHYAACSQNIQMLKKLIAEGTNMNIPCRNGWTALHKVVENDLISSFKVLVESGVNLTTLGPKGITPILMIVKWNRVHMLRYLWEHGMDIYTTNGKSTLDFAVFYEAEEVVVFLQRAKHHDLIFLLLNANSYVVKIPKEILRILCNFL